MLGKAFAAMREKAPKYDEISACKQCKLQSAEKQAAMNAEADVMSNGMASYGSTKGSAMQARQY
jgi:hypothetical protein